MNACFTEEQLKLQRKEIKITEYAEDTRVVMKLNL
jgi:hypothetical protein